jgi:hypothetical protein
MVTNTLPAGRDGVWAVRGENWAQVYAPDIPGMDVTLEVNEQLAAHYSPERAYMIGLALAGLYVTVEIDEGI